MVTIYKHSGGFYILGTERKVLDKTLYYQKAYEFELSLGIAYDQFLVESDRDLNLEEDKRRKQLASPNSPKK